MYNFLDHKLLPKVTTAAAAMDNYEVSNLISDNPMVRARGFLGYTSMKPPLDIDFELLCPISMRYVVINAAVGTQRTVGIEIFVKSGESDFVPIGKSFFEESGVIFANARFYSKTNPPKSGDYYLAFFKGHLFRIFNNAKVVRIRILRTERSTPCLGPVEINGIISKLCPPVTAESVERLMNKKEQNIKVFKEEGSNVETTKYDFEICDEFKDALTFEVMAMPMTLPSGHSVDQSTLEKCIANDSNYGRQGCDPFTGLPFTDSRKPKLNIPLKNRIDMFLLTNSHRKETQSIGRTVGKKCEVTKDINYYTNNKIPKINCIDDDGSIGSNSLDDAIAKIMNSNDFVSFTKDVVEIKEDLLNNCVQCQCNVSLYELPCRHLICRNCLLSCNSKCISCERSFERKDVKKYHK